MRSISVDEAGIARWLKVYVAVLIGDSSDEIDVDAPLSRFDLDSVDAVEMASEFEKAFLCEVGPELFLGDASIREMASILVAEAAGGAN